MLTQIKEGLRIYKTSKERKAKGFHKYRGDAKKICKQIVRDCWNGKYFQTSTKNFSQFWTRDFGWCVTSLMRLGYKKEIHKTLTYALRSFYSHGQITTAITPEGKAFDFPTYSIDSIPYLIRAIHVSQYDFSEHLDFINQQVNDFANTVFNFDTMKIKPKHFSSIKDYAKRKGACYDYCMLHLLSKTLDKIGIHNPFKSIDFETLIKLKFWTGKYFKDDESKKNYIAGDANLFPFLTGLANKELLPTVIQTLEKEGLTQPFPLKYTTNKAPVKFIWQEKLIQGYEKNSIWAHMGPLFIHQVAQVNKNLAEKYKESYTKLIEEHKTFLEVYSADGKPFNSKNYFTDEGMLWAATYLTL